MQSFDYLDILHLFKTHVFLHFREVTLIRQGTRQVSCLADCMFGTISKTNEASKARISIQEMAETEIAATDNLD
jgi:hypothetical protein